MTQIKIFKSVETDTGELEQEVNRWIAESGATIVQVFGNIAPQTTPDEKGGGLSGSRFAPSDVLLVVVYET